MLKIGDKFPEFSLLAHDCVQFEHLTLENAFKTIDNKTYDGKWLVVFFYPKDFTFICPTEIAGFSDMQERFAEMNAQILGCSIDSEFVHFAWRKYHKPINGLRFPLMSDIKRELCSKLGILNNDGVTDRALFIVDPEGTIRFIMVTDPSVGRNPEEVLRVLSALQTGELCPCSWQPKQETIDLKRMEV